MITREQFEERKRQWEEMNLWERAQPRDDYSPEQALEAMDALWQWIPEPARLAAIEERDLDRRGVQRMHELLRHARPR